MARFLHVSSYAPPHGGAARVMADQAEAQRLYHDDAVSVVSFEPGFAYLKEKGVSVNQLRGIAVRQDWLLGLREYGQLWRLVGKSDRIVLHSPYYFINCVVAIMAKLRKKHAVCLHHGHLPSEFRNKLNISFINTLVKGWLILDPAHERYLSSYVGRLKPVRLIQNGIWKDRLQKYRDNRPHSRSISRFVYCGRIVWDKGVRELAEAIAQFPDLGFDIIGDGEDALLFQGLPNVTLHGFLPHEESLRIIAAADCLILPSYHETFPMVIAEALGMGVPVIAGDLNAPIRKLLKGNGILVEPKSSASLVGALQAATEKGLAVTESGYVDSLDWKPCIGTIRQAILTLS